jgi:hypothetical protein
MEEIVELRFKYSEKEYVSAYRRYSLAQRRPTFFIIIAIALIIAGVYFLVSGGDTALTVSLIATGAFLFGLLVTSMDIVPRRRFRADPRFKSEYLLRFADSGIEFHTDQIDAKISWSIYKQALETRHFYLLSDGASTLTVIPKRAFADPDQEFVFKEMLSKKV